MTSADALDRPVVAAPSQRIGVFVWASERAWTLAAVGLFGVFLIVILAIAQDYGISYDEDWREQYGNQIISWYRTGFRDTTALTYFDFQYYGGFFYVVRVVAGRLSPLGEFETAHLVDGLCAFLGVVGTYRLARLLGGPAAGLFAAVFLVFIPRFFGHAFINPIDVPIATLGVFALYYLAQLVLMARPDAAWGLAIKLGLVIGLSLGMRIGTLLLLAYTGLALTLWFANHHLPRSGAGFDWPSMRSTLFRLTGVFATICGVAYATMLIFWPAALASPFLQPIRALRHTPQSALGPFDLFFDGHFVPDEHLPWYYVSKYFLITLPEFVFLVLGAGATLAIVGYIRSDWALRDLLRGSRLILVILLAAVFVPVAYTAVTAPRDYDEVRHFLFVLPPLAVLGGLSAVALQRRLRRSWLARAVGVGVVASIGLTIVDLVQLHPYQYVFFNRAFGGGVAHAATLYETDYWGTSMKEGVEWLVRTYPPDGTGRRVKVATCLYPLSTSYYLPIDRFEFLGSYDTGGVVSTTRPDVFLASTRWGCDQRLDGVVVHTVTRQDAPLLTIKVLPANDAPSAPAPTAAPGP